MKPIEIVDYSVLANVNDPADLRRLSLAELNKLAEEIRRLIINTVASPAVTWPRRWAPWN